MFSFPCLLALTLCSTLSGHMVQSDSHSMEQREDISEISQTNEAQNDQEQMGQSSESNSNFNSDFGFGNDDQENHGAERQFQDEQQQQQQQQSQDFSDASLEEQDGKETNGRDGDPIIESFRTQLEDANRAMKGEQPKESFHFEVDQ